MKEYNPLVSVIVITFNSRQYVLKTLESIKAQSYVNIELIISDDGSNDGTVEVCRKWIEENKERFAETKLITSNVNTGMAPNCNRGLQAAKAAWIKIIAGDDELLPNCIDDNLTVVENNKLIRILFSNMVKFEEINTKKKYFEKFPSERHKIFFNTSPETQFLNLINDNFVCPAASAFIHKQTLIDMGKFDEQFPFMEDQPFWVKCTENNIPLFYFDIDTALYRKGNSITQRFDSWIHKSFYKSLKGHFEKKVSQHLKIHNRNYYYTKKLFFLKYDVLLYFFKNKRNFFSKSFNFLFDSILLNNFRKMSIKKIIPGEYYKIKLRDK